MDQEEDTLTSEDQTPQSLDDPKIITDQTHHGPMGDVGSDSTGEEIDPIEETGLNIKVRDSGDEKLEMASPQRVLDILISGRADSDYTGSSEESTSVAQDRGSSPTTRSSHGSQWRSVISGLIRRKKGANSKARGKAMRRLSTFPPVATDGSRLSLKLAKLKLSGEQHHGREFQVDGGSLLFDKWKPSWRSFSFEELKTATDNFSSEKLIGRGGHAEVYKGCMSDGQLVAVKRLMKKDMEERVADFLSELGVIAHVNHPNAACLLGFGVDGGLHLVLKFSPHGSLSSALHGSKDKLGWEIRFKIALGIAEGLLYLHEGCHRRIIHRDIKASNILLTDDYEPQISDFGLAKWLPDRWNHHVMFPIEGTFGYLAPEYFMHGLVSEKTDVFAFGVLLLELLTGRRAVDSNRQSLVIWAKPYIDAKDLEGLIGPSFKDSYNKGEMHRTISAASACIRHLPNLRPSMKQVLELLRGEDESMLITSSDALKQPGTGVGRRPIPLAMSDSDGGDYTCSKYLNDLNRHKQLALEQ